MKDAAPGALSGDPRAYERFLNLVRCCVRPRFERLLPLDLVDDALQETLLAVHKSLHTLDPSRPVGPWLAAIADYKAQDQLRALYRNGRHEELRPEDWSFTSGVEDGLQAEKLLSSLSERERRIVIGLKHEGRSVDELAQELKLGASNVKVTAFRAVQKMRERLLKEGIDEIG